MVDLKLSDGQATEIGRLQKQGLKLLIVKKLRDQLGYSHKEAKTIMAHLNSEADKCHRCGCERLLGEYAECPKCKAFNYNFNWGMKQ